MKRRQFLTVLTGAAVGSPFVARAQQPALPVVGFLRVTSLADSVQLVTAFQLGLKQAGFVDGENVTIEYRWGEGRDDRLAALAADLVHRRAAVIVGHSTAALAAKAATSKAAILFVIGNDPVRIGLVTNLNQPGGNVTGIMFTTVDVTAKRLGQLADLVPKAELIGVLGVPTFPENEVAARDAEVAAKTIGRRVMAVTAGAPGEFNPVFDKLVQAGAGALLVGGSAFFTSQRQRLIVLSARHAIPTSYSERTFVAAGGLMSYGPSQPDAYRRAGVYAGRILKGEKPGDLPVEQPTKFELIINLGTAKNSGSCGAQCDPIDRRRNHRMKQPAIHEAGQPAVLVLARLLQKEWGPA